MLHPNQFRVNQAWIAFKLNAVPVHTELDGDFDCMALMDAASCFILTVEMFPTAAAEPSTLHARRMLTKGRAHRQQLPETLYIPIEQPADNLVIEAQRRKVRVVRIPDDQLLLFIGDAREGFNEEFGTEG